MSIPLALPSSLTTSRSRNWGRAADIRSDDIVHQVMAQHAAGIRQSVGPEARDGVQQDTCGLQRRGSQHDDAAFRFVGFLTSAIEKQYASGLAAPIDLNFPHYSVTAEREAPGFGRGGKSIGNGIPESSGIATAPTTPTIVTGSKAIHTPRTLRSPLGNNPPPSPMPGASFCTMRSPQFSGKGGRYSAVRKCGMCSMEPATPTKLSTLS